MSELESIKKLREIWKHLPAPTHFDELRLAEMDACIRELEAEVDERFMCLPVDANNEPIRPGDQMTDYSKRVDGLGIAKWDVVSVNECAFFDMSHGLHIANQHYHVKPRTLEDVLNDCADDISLARGIAPELDRDTPTRNEILNKYAAEIRELLGGDA